MKPLTCMYQASDADLATLIRQRLEKVFVQRTFSDGHLLWKEGEMHGLLVDLLEGRVKIFRLLPEGRAVTVYLFGPGDLFGFMPIFDETPYPVYAQALGPITVRTVSPEHLISAVRQDPDLALLLLRQLSRRLREAFSQIEILSTRGVLLRVAIAMSSLIPQGHVATDAILTLPVASHEFAGLYGLTPESFSRGITQLVEAGILHRIETRKFQLRKPDALQALVRGDFAI